MTGPFQLSFSSDGREASDVVAGKIAAGEAAGASAFWCANHLFQRDPISLCALALARTASLRVTLMALRVTVSRVMFQKPVLGTRIRAGKRMKAPP